MVADIITQNKDKIAALCRKYRVRALWVFGSAATGGFDPESSDIDFLVDLGEYTSDYADLFFRSDASLPSFSSSTSIWCLWVG